TQPQYSPLKPNPDFDPVQAQLRALGGEKAPPAFLPTKPRVDIPTEADLPASIVNRARQIADEGVPYQKGKVLSEKAAAKDSSLRDIADYLRNKISTQHPEVTPHNQTMRQAFQLKRELTPKFE